MFKILISFWNFCSVNQHKNQCRTQAGMKLRRQNPGPEMATLKSTNQKHRMLCSVKKITQSHISFQTWEPDHSLILVRNVELPMQEPLQSR